ncbi:hypothetical protein BB559_003218 [Furculomyces boomerangus]|uniref:PXA domain-containing protein n=1 Tax=Furculomyces boomerangus TaxID=61424 RepID=A0A2T9YMQ7_9FUNG|nr:hypothetical protein BB559_003218 [Furculomyces boomerangus]
MVEGNAQKIVNSKAHQHDTKEQQIYIKSSTLVNKEISELINLVIRDFVDEWYNGITKNEEFQIEIKNLISIVFLRLEQRILSVDWTKFIFFDLTKILKTHLQDVRQCEARLGTIYSGKCSSIEELFRSRNPHVAMLAAADSELSYLRHLSNELLLFLLPKEFLQDEISLHLVREIFGCLILRAVVDIGANPSTLNNIIIKKLGKFSCDPYFSEADMSRYVSFHVTENKENQHEEPKQALRNGAQPKHTVQEMLSEAISTNINSERNPSGNSETNLETPKKKLESIIMLLGHFKKTGKALRYIWEGMKSFVGLAVSKFSEYTFSMNWGLMAAENEARKDVSHYQKLLSLYYGKGGTNNSGNSFSTKNSFSSMFKNSQQEFFRSSIYGRQISSLFQNKSVYSGPEYNKMKAKISRKTYNVQYGDIFRHLLLTADTVMLMSAYNSWLFVQINFYIIPIFTIFMGKITDMLLTNALLNSMNENIISEAIVDLKNVLWPGNGKFDKGNDYRTPEQENILRDDAIELVAELFPTSLTRLFYGNGKEDRIEAARAILGPLQNRQLNKHLVYTVLDSFVGLVFPELLENS